VPVKVLLIVVDGASPRVVSPAIQTGRLSNLKRVADAGVLHAGAVTIFPSITPAATTSIVTGCYPAEHGIGGASWYDESRKEVVYYGDDFWVIARKGFGAFLRDFLVHLNGDRLKAPTVFELVERSGLSAACVNYLVYRGDVSHKVNVPWLMALLPGVPLAETVKGPSLLCLGDFVTPRAVRGRKVDGRGGLLHRFGMDDASTAAILCDLVEAGALADFTLAYFADNDYESHAVGPHAALPVIDRVDAALGRVFDAAGGFERFMHDTCVIVTSDHGHCEVLDDRDESIVALDDVLGDFRQAELGRSWRARDEIMICPNMRAAQIHLRQPSAVLLDRVTRALLGDARVDLVLKRQKRTHDGSDAYVVDSSRGRLELWRHEDGRAGARDSFGTAWGWRGEAGVLRLEMDGGRVDSTEYPNAFERIAGALDAVNQGDIWVSARPGCEFEVPGGKGHVGGASHGALHALDSLSIAVAGGVDAAVLPAVLRTVDIAPLCTALLGSPMRYAVGEARRLAHALG
jgi:predicted AlkP superfamily pyrophosphatase or phosphodiesterase